MDTKALRAVSLGDSVAEASKTINSLYPLTNFIACNALKEMENISFVDAMRNADELYGARGFLPLSDYRAMYESGRIAPGDLEEAFAKNKSKLQKTQINPAKTFTFAEMFDQKLETQFVTTINRQMVKWCSAFLDRTQAQWRPDSSLSLFLFWKDLAVHDLAMTFYGVENWDKSVKLLPDSSIKTLEVILAELEIKDEQLVPYLKKHIFHLPGFASHLKWRETELGEKSILVDYLAIRLHYEKMLCQAASKEHYLCSDLGLVKPLLEGDTRAKVKTQTQQDDYGPVWQDAYELNYRNKLLSNLNVAPVQEEDKSCCQMVFCIDVRSEPIRRRLEQLGPYSTFGFAGFFAMPMQLSELGSQSSLALCPVLLKPEKAVSETASNVDAIRKVSFQALKVSAMQLKKKLKCNLAGTFGLVELIGLFSAVPLFAKTFFPAKNHRVLKMLEQNGVGQPCTTLDLCAFSLEDKITLANGAIKGIGLKTFAKLIVLCGHKSSSINNPYASALDCGACGGNGGGYSARLAAMILNDQEVRLGLLDKGIEIPCDTKFIAGEHDTTTDQFVFFDIQTLRLTREHETIFEKLKADLSTAGESLRKARAASLPQSCLTVMNEPAERAFDWAQIAPEWGLAGNAAFIAAPRGLTKSTDLQGRVFLHSYDYSHDKDGKVLELIMTAPLVVAQWINMQYYLSTMDNSKFGSGSKVVHNVVGDFGVMRGASSDLKLGLPIQSIATADALQHEPMRLLAVIRAPLKAIDTVLKQHAQVRQLVSNNWIRLVALDPSDSLYYEALEFENWTRIEPEKQFMKESASNPEVLEAACYAKNQ